MMTVGLGGKGGRRREGVAAACAARGEKKRGVYAQGDQVREQAKFVWDGSLEVVVIQVPVEHREERERGQTSMERKRKRERENGRRKQVVRNQKGQRARCAPRTWAGGRGEQRQGREIIHTRSHSRERSTRVWGVRTACSIQSSF